jgi:hypothetical protein
MDRVVQTVGVLMGAGLGAEYFKARGHDRDYNFWVRTEKGGVVVDKDNTSGIYLLSIRHQTRFHFHNDTGVNLTARMFEPGTCHFDIKPGTRCKSDELPIRPGRTGTLRIEKQTYDGSCRPGSECEFMIQLKLESGPWFDVDPKLQIEEARLKPDLVHWLLAGVAVGLVIAPPLIRYLNRRR